MTNLARFYLVLILFAGYSGKTQINPYVEIDHLMPGGVDTLGGMSITGAEASPPYNWNWSPVEIQSSTITELDRGNYDLEMTDGQSNHVMRSYLLGYKALWLIHNGTMWQNDRLITSGTPSSNPSAMSKNVLQSGEDGWMQFIVPDFNKPYTLGFQDASINQLSGDYFDVEVGFHVSYGNELYTWHKGSFKFVGIVEKGDVVVLKRVGNDYLLLINNVLLVTLPVSQNKNVRIKAVMSLGENSIEGLGCSFGTALKPVISIEHAGVHELNNASIFLRGAGGLNPYSFKWEDGEVSNYKNGLRPGRYRFWMSDSSLTDQVMSAVEVGLKPNWQLIQNVLQKSDSLKLQSSDVPGVLVSNNTSAPQESAWFEFRVNDKNADLAFGFISKQVNSINTEMSSEVFPTSYLLERAAALKSRYLYVESASASGTTASLTPSANDLHFARLSNGVLTLMTDANAVDSYSVANNDVLRAGRASDGFFYVSLNGKVVYSSIESVLDRHLVSAIVVGSGNAVLSEMGIFTDAAPEQLALRVKRSEACASVGCRKWSSVKTYDEMGNILSESKQYYDDLMRTTQTQQKVISDGNVLASEDLYDAFGRSCGSTLAAPIYQTALCYKPDFFMSPNNMSHYSVTHHDATATRNNPIPVSNQAKGQLGWYYSDNNTEEPNVSADQYPYARVVYDRDPLNRIVRSSGVGENHRMGSTHEKEYQEITELYNGGVNELQSVFPGLSNELADDFKFKTYDHISNGHLTNKNLINVRKFVSRDEDGKLEYWFIDNSGRLAATCVRGVSDGACMSSAYIYALSPGVPKNIMTAFSNVYGPNSILFIEKNFPQDIDITIQLNGGPYLSNNDFDYQKQSGQIIFRKTANCNLTTGNISFYITYTIPGGVALPVGSQVSATIKRANTQWTLYYYDIKGRLKAIQAPSEVICTPPILSKSLVATGDNAFLCDKTKVLASADLRMDSETGLVSPTFARVSLAPQFLLPDTLTNTLRSDFNFETSDLSKRDTLDPFLSWPATTPFNNGTITTISSTDSSNTLSSSGIDPKSEIAGKEINYTGSYLLGVRRADNSVYYYQDKPFTFNYTLRLNKGEAQMINNDTLSGSSHDLILDSAWAAKEILVKASDIQIRLRGFQGISPVSPFNPCNLSVYIDQHNAQLVNLINSNVSLQMHVNSFALPAGLHTMPTNPASGTAFSKKYWYNEYDHLIATESQDEGLTQYLYDLKEDKLRFSQNAKQALTGKFSYISYDKLGRVIETGEYDPALAEPSAVVNGSLYTPPLYYFEGYYSPQMNPNTVSLRYLAQLDENIFELSQRKTQQNYLAYDSPDQPAATFPYTYAKVSKAWNNQSTTRYVYNERAELLKATNDVNGLGTKTFEYTYDFTGKMLSESYQNATAERIVHEHSYDADSRFLQTLAKIGSGNVQTQLSRFFYYQHGALKRNEIGNKLQGLDYIYTIGGLLKSVNNPFAPSNGNDPGLDGVAANTCKPDVFAYTLQYYPNDFRRSQGPLSAVDAPSNLSGDPDWAFKYSGLVQSVRWKTTLPSVANNQFQSSVLVYEFGYDNLNRLKRAEFGTASIAYPTCIGCTPEFYHLPTGDYKLEGITYDRNGNLKTLKRYKETNGGTAQVMDDLTYHYQSAPGQKNKLLFITDQSASNLSSDVDFMSHTSLNNYQYDASGAVQVSVKENQSYVYNFQGLVKEVRKLSTNTMIASFEYNHLNLRQKKVVYDNAGNAIEATYYVYSPGGQLVATYVQSLVSGGSAQLQELVLYGPGRMGTYKIASQKACFELTDHLGSVRALVTESNGQADVIEYTDYFPHGGVLPGRHYSNSLPHRNTFQGQEKDLETGLVNFELRQYDPRIGRWQAPDPYGQHHSPYLAMSNNPVSFIDLDGGFDETAGCFEPSLYERHTNKYNPDVVARSEFDNNYNHGGHNGGSMSANGSFASNDTWITEAHGLWTQNHIIPLQEEAERQRQLQESDLALIPVDNEGQVDLSREALVIGFNSLKASQEYYAYLKNKGLLFEQSVNMKNNSSKSDKFGTGKVPGTGGGYKIEKAVSWLNNNAHESWKDAKGQCAKYVRQALEAGGLNTKGRPVPAWQYSSFLPKLGFTSVRTTNYRKGDIAVMKGYPGATADPKTGIPYGHIQMFDGTRWVSDFKQRDFWPGGGYRTNQPAFEIFRWGVIQN